jgi:glycosyltransferase involved in cell wall biosynthesis
MITGRDIVLISSIEWNFLWQVAQEIALRFAHAGNRVFYVENMGVRSLKLRDAQRVVKRLARWTRSLSSEGVQPIDPNLSVYSPLVLPPFGPAWRRHLNRRLLLPMVRRSAQRWGIRDPLLWTLLPTDTALDLINLFRTPRSTVVYYSLADFSQLTPYVSQLRQSEKDIVQQSDLVFANSSRLAAHCRQWRDDVHVFPPGVNLDAFPTNGLPNTSARETITQLLPRAEAQLASPSASAPIIGYVGGLHRYVDFQLLFEMARARPDWLWVFVGPMQTDAGELSKLPNVLLPGHRPHSELINFIRSFDVCIVPYLNNPETATVVPVKINEYLAAGKPVVATELPSICDFNDLHGVLAISEAQPERFLRAIENSLAAGTDQSITDQRRKVAALADWELQLEAMSELIEAKEKSRPLHPLA